MDKNVHGRLIYHSPFNFYISWIFFGVGNVPEIISPC